MDNPLAAVLEHYGADLHRTQETGWRPIKCPYHEDRTASASVNLSKGGFRCHGCGVAGDAIKLVMTQEGLGYADAVAFIEQVSGQSLADVRRPAPRDAPRVRSKWRHTLFEGTRD